MQLSSKKAHRGHGKIATSLAAATCSLLGMASSRSLADEEPKRWSYDTALLYYGEQQGRVADISGSVAVQRLFGENRRLSFHLSVDSLTGASPSGAVPALTPQTFTSPSGNDSYTTPAGEVPLDPTFLDTRIALGADFQHELGRYGRLSYGLSFSTEYDYGHTGAHATYSRDFHDRNMTLDLGVAFASDSIDPVGGAPTPFATMLPEGQTENKLGDDSKTVTDLLVGVTRVLGPRSLGQLNYSFSRSSGYLNDPYKVISVLDPVTGDPVAGPGNLNLVLFEGRPADRTQHALFARYKRHLQRDVIDTSYRFSTSDWGVQSHTLDLRYRLIFKRQYLEPHARYYVQSEADFHVPYLLDGPPLPDHASADDRLGEMDAVTLGFKYGLPLGGGREWSARAEYYTQSGTSPPGAAFGSLNGLDLVAPLDAVIVQVGYRF